MGAGVNIVLSGHKHVPYVWRIENLYVANAGTVASLRLRGYTKPCYNILTFEGDEVGSHGSSPSETATSSRISPSRRALNTTGISRTRFRMPASSSAD